MFAFPTSPLLGGGGASSGGGPVTIPRDIIWVDLRVASGVGNNGSDSSPYNTANLGLGSVPDGGTLAMVGGDASTEPGVTIGAKSFAAIGLGGQKASGGLTPVLPTLTYAITTGTQRLAFRNISVALVHSGTASSLTEFYFEYCPSITLTAGVDAPPVYLVGDRTCTFSGSGGAAQFIGGTIAGYTANGGGAITARDNHITSDLTSSSTITLVGACSFGGALSITAPTINVDLATLYNATVAGVSFSTTVHLLVPFGTPSDIGTANSTGIASTMLPSDHVHRLTFTTWNAAAAGANAPININGQRITGAGAPTSGTDLVTKTYADAIAVGLKVKTPAVAVATANQATMSGTAQTVDGVALNTVGMRVLLTAQTTATQNGLWVVQSGAWTRPTDFATGSGAAQSYVLVTGGTANAGSSYFCTNATGSDVVDTANLTWVLFSQSATVTAHNGLTKTGNQLDVVAGDTTIVVSIGSLVVGVIGNANLADNTIALARLVNASGTGHFLMRKSASGGAWEDGTAADAKAALGIIGNPSVLSVRAATTASITLSGTQTVDGVALIAGDRCLVKDQGTGSQNGLYVVAAGAWSRSSDASSAGQLFGGLLVTISEGTANGNQAAQLTTDDPITIGTTALTFSMGRVAAVGAVAPLDVTDGAAQVGNSTLAAPLNHVHHLPSVTVLALIAVAATAISVNSQKITSLANGTVSADAVNLGQLTSAVSAAIGAPASPGDNGKLAYANAGVLAYAAGVTTGGGLNLAVAATAATGTVAPTLKVTDAAHTALTASTERNSVLFDFGQTRQWATGALASQRSLRMLAPTIAFVGASTVSLAATASISGAPVAGANATLTNSFALLLESGALGFGTSGIARSALVRAQNGVAIIGARTAADSGDIGVLSTDSSDNVTIGDAANTAGVQFAAKSGGFIGGFIAGSLEYQFDAATLNLHGNSLTSALFLSATGTVANSGFLRMPGGGATIVVARTTGGADYAVLSTDSSDHYVLGSTGATAAYYNVAAGGSHNLQINSGVEYTFDATNLTMNGNNLLMGAGFISQGSNPSTQGAHRLTASSGAGGIWFRNNGLTADIAAMFSGTDDVLYLGDGTNSAGVNLRSKATGFVQTIFGSNATLNVQQSTLSFTPVAATSGTAPVAFTVTGAAHTGLSASTEPRDINFALNRTVTMAAGALTNARSVYCNAPTYAFASASTITQASTIAISGAPVPGTNATITRGYALLVESGGIGFGSTPSSNSFVNVPFPGGVASIVGVKDSGGTDRTIFYYNSVDHTGVFSSVSVDLAGGGNIWKFAATATFPGVAHAVAAGGHFDFGATPSTGGLINATYSGSGQTIIASTDSGSFSRPVLSFSSGSHAQLGSGNISVDVISSGGTWAFGSTAAFPGVEHNLATGGFISSTATHAASGFVRSPVSSTIIASKHPTSGDIAVVATNSSGEVLLGSSTAANTHVSSAGSVLMEPGGTFYIEAVGGAHEWSFGATASFPGVEHAFAAGAFITLANLSSAPPAPSSGGRLYMQNGAVKVIDSNGDITELSPEFS